MKLRLIITVTLLGLSVLCLAPVSVLSICQTEFIVIGVTLGNGWQGFPTYLATDYTTSSQFTQLDVTLPLYVTFVSTNEDTMRANIEAAGYQNLGGSLYRITPPIPITDPLLQRWYNANTVGLFTVKAARQGFDPDPNPDQPEVLEPLYVGCATGKSLEEPT